MDRISVWFQWFGWLLIDGLVNVGVQGFIACYASKTHEPLNLWYGIWKI